MSQLSGVLPIVTTPFDAEGRLDLASLDRVVEHILAGGAQGVVYPAIASEFQTLTPAERRAGVERVMAVVAGRVPVVVGVSCGQGESDMTPVVLAVHAAAQKAAAVMLMPQPAGKGSASVRDQFAALADAADLPIILQNAPPPLGPALAIEALLEVIAAVPAIRYVKEETLPCGQRISRLLAADSGLAGVFGGAGGRFVLDELARGALGSMPACEFTALHVALYERFRAGDREAARRLFNAMLPLLNFESVFRTPATKHILHAMGIIASPRYRDHNPALDEADRVELSLILADLDAAQRCVKAGPDGR